MKNFFALLILILFFNCKRDYDKNNRSVDSQISTERYIVYKKFPSKFVEERNIEVWLPSGYDGAEALPVLYMFDGQNIFHNGFYYGSYNQGWQVDETLDSLFSMKNIPELIVVGIFHTGERRFSEYMPAKPTIDIRQRMINAEQWFIDSYEKYGITSDKLLRFIVEELKPFIDKNYKTISTREGTFVAGSSMGGLISAYAMCEYPNVFGGAACMSTHWPVLNGYFINYLENNLPVASTHRIYFDHGTLGLDSTYEYFQTIVDSLMIAKGYKENSDWITKKFEGTKHHEDHWRERFHQPIEFLFKKQ